MPLPHDICRCSTTTCRGRDHCLRFTDIPSEAGWLAYADLTPDDPDLTCRYIIPEVPL